MRAMLEPVGLYAAQVDREEPIAKHVHEIWKISLELHGLLQALGTASHHGANVVGGLDAAMRVVECIEGIAEELEDDLKTDTTKPAPVETPAKPKRKGKR